MTITAAVFDMDGIIFDTERLSFETFKQASEEAGWKVSYEAFLASMGLPRRSIPPRLTEVLGASFPAARVLDRSYELLESAVERHGPPLKDGIEDILGALEGRSIPAIVATSTEAATARAYLHTAGLLDRFVGVVGGDEIERGKPDPDIFLHAAEALETAPEHVIVFEDSTNGVRAGSAAGMRVIMIPDFIEPSPEIAALTFAIVPSLHEAAGRIDELLA
ncbi:MAG: HAD family hydrolase [Spirochaetaceae bacterium]